MNTETGIPIDFCRKITPFVPGDVYYNNFVDAEFTMDQQDADGFNNADPRGEFNTYFIVSFADRPNTGKQPVDDDVVVSINNDDGVTYFPNTLCWEIDYAVETWKPCREVMLAKFKEQGANTMTKLAEQKRLAHAVALMTNALDDNPDEQVIEPWVGDQLDDLINPVSEGCQADKPLKAGDVISVSYDELPPANHPDFDVTPMPREDASLEDIAMFNAELDKPVFTQEMADAGDRPKAMMECLVFNTLLVSPKYEKAVIDFIGEWCCVYTSESCRERSASVDDLLFKPIDSRTDEQRAADDLIEIMQSNEHTYPEIIGLIKSGKIHGVKWIIE